MKNAFFASLLAAMGLIALGGCDRSATVKTQETVTGPGGTTTTTIEKTVESTGDNPPANSSGERVNP